VSLKKDLLKKVSFKKNILKKLSESGDDSILPVGRDPQSSPLSDNFFLNTLFLKRNFLIIFFLKRLF